ncbi:MAG TPA: glycoside hydrolase family 5 protein [Ramlibacter sp.]|nr:glycoside hydrolase family 5 protein [Ramlibacter sp.]
MTPETCTVAHALKRGINLGNMLDAPREGDWGVKLEPAFIDRAAASFATVRLPVRWTNHAAPTADATIDEAFAARVDKAVDALLAKGVYVIINVHHYTQISGDAQHREEFAVDPAVVDQRLVNIWRQLGQRYKDRSPKLMFELLNEAHGRLTPDAWNTLMPRALAAVRATNPTRIVLVGPGEYGSITELPKLRLPPDRNLIVAIHNYDPFPFTHQGADFLPKPLPTGVTCCDAVQRKAIVDALEAARRWNQGSGYPMHLGEFGTYKAVDMTSRGNYARIVRDEAERRGIGWAYWELASPSFGMFVPETGQWQEPIRRALLD